MAADRSHGIADCRDPSRFYDVHLGWKPDPHSIPIMIVNGAQRKMITENSKG